MQLFSVFRGLSIPEEMASVWANCYLEITQTESKLRANSRDRAVASAAMEFRLSGASESP